MSFIILSLLLSITSAQSMTSDYEDENIFQSLASKKRKQEEISQEKELLLQIRIEFCKDNFKEIGAASSNTPWRSCLVYDNTHQRNELVFGFCNKNPNPTLNLEQIFEKHLKSLNGSVYLFETQGEMKIKDGIVTFPSLANKSRVSQDIYLYRIQSIEI